ncbi:hypothetical protein HR060_18850 [Catenovulum sp. SM1970]|nr:hypothetical protein [Marinifaba aquimaris]NTS78904.1 hypothetical protein [Marinifaba aquimaris]
MTVTNDLKRYWQGAIKYADNALYYTKSNGRDGAFIYQYGELKSLTA